LACFVSIVVEIFNEFVIVVLEFLKTFIAIQEFVNCAASIGIVELSYDESL
jgi:hypothetical protein